MKLVNKNILEMITIKKRGHMNISTKGGCRNTRVYIASAIRTPIGRFQGQLSSFTATQLGGLVVEAAAKRAAIPYESINELYMGNVFTAGEGQAPARQAALFGGLKKTTCCTTINQTWLSSMKAIALAAQCIQIGRSNVAIAGGMDALSHVPYYLKRGITLYGEIHLADGLIEQEPLYRNTITSSSSEDPANKINEDILEIKIQKRGNPLILIDCDECAKSSSVEECQKSFTSDAAAALVLANEATVRELNLKPLAALLGYGTYYERNISRIISKLLNAYDLKLENLEKLKIVACGNFDGNSSNNIQIFENIDKPTGFHGACLMTHLSHCLQPGEAGCAIIGDAEGFSSVMLIEKLCHICEDLPTLTLYTQDSCPLCDILVEELEMNFAGQYCLKKVYIDVKENVRFLRLYRNDIPVLFLNGQFLCMHRLNHELLSKKLKAINNNSKT